MKLIVGLGNPGRKYAKTRHNVGHLFITVFSKQLTADSRKKKEAKSRKPKAVCRKTTVFMNSSGEEVKKLTTASCLLPPDLLIVHDDMDLPLGEFKLQKGRGAAGHKGVQSIIDALGTKDFWRLRFGIGKPSAGTTPEDFVLSEFSREELEMLHGTFEEAYPFVLDWVG